MDGAASMGIFHREYPDRTAPNGPKSTLKSPVPTLLSSRSGVRVPSGVPLFCKVLSAKQNMVDIAQLVSASDCGSEGRGFESHYPPHKNKGCRKGIPYFYSCNGIRRIKCNADERCLAPAGRGQHLYFRQERKCKQIPLSTP